MSQLRPLIILSFLLISQTIRAQVPIPNGNFEVWDFYNTWTLDPLDWQTLNNQLSSHVFQDSAAFEGDFAMRVFPNTFFEPLPGAARTEFAIDAIPASFDFAVKCFIEQLDSVFVRVSFVNTNGGSDWIIQESAEWHSDVSIDEWEVISLELNQIEPVIDLCVVQVITGYGDVFLEGSPNTWISVDAMGFEGLGTSLLEQKTQEVQVYYSSVQGRFIVHGLAEESAFRQLRVWSLDGRLIFMAPLSQTLPNLTSGIYLYELSGTGIVQSGKFHVP